MSRGKHRKATAIDPMKGSLDALVDGIAAVGGTDEQLGRAALAISQMSGKGVIQMEELRQQLGDLRRNCPGRA
jgi:phage tail tape-measure protein